MKKQEFSQERQNAGEGLGIKWKHIYKDNPRIPRPVGILLSKVADNAFELKPFPANCRDQNPTHIQELLNETVANSTLHPITVMFNSNDRLYRTGDGNHLQKVAKQQGEIRMLAYIMVGNLKNPKSVWRFWRYSYRINKNNMNSIEKAIAVNLAYEHYGRPKYDYRQQLSKDLMESEKDVSLYLKIYKEMNKLPEVEKLKFMDSIIRDEVGPSTTLTRVQNFMLEEDSDAKEINHIEKNLEVHEKIDRRVRNSINALLGVTDIFKSFNIENEEADSKARTKRIIGMMEEQKTKHDPHNVSTLKTEIGGLNESLKRTATVIGESLGTIQIFIDEYNAVEEYIRQEDNRWKNLNNKKNKTKTDKIKTNANARSG